MIGVLGIFCALVVKIPLAENLFIHNGPQTYPLSYDLWFEQTFVPTREKLIGFKLVFKKVNDVDHLVKIEIVKQVNDEEKSIYKGSFSSKEIKDNHDYSFWLSQPLEGKGGEGKKFWKEQGAN